jgi:hypothetical protein
MQIGLDFFIDVVALLLLLEVAIALAKARVAFRSTTVSPPIYPTSYRRIRKWLR